MVPLWQVMVRNRDVWKVDEATFVIGANHDIFPAEEIDREPVGNGLSEESRQGIIPGYINRRSRQSHPGHTLADTGGRKGWWARQDSNLGPRDSLDPLVSKRSGLSHHPQPNC